MFSNNIWKLSVKEFNFSTIQNFSLNFFTYIFHIYLSRFPEHLLPGAPVFLYSEIYSKKHFSIDFYNLQKFRLTQQFYRRWLMKTNWVSGFFDIWSFTWFSEKPESQVSSVNSVFILPKHRPSSFSKDRKFLLMMKTDDIKHLPLWWVKIG